MDATTNQKTLSGLLAALLVGGVFFAAVPTATAQSTFPFTTGATGVIAEVSTLNPFVNFTQGSLIFDNLYDIRVTNISRANFGVNVNDQFGLYLPNNNTALRTAQAGTDDLHGSDTFLNVTFLSVRTTLTGNWSIKGPSGFVKTINVSAQPNLQVTVTPSSFVYNEGSNNFLTVSVVNTSNGQPADGVTVQYLGRTDLTGANGQPAGQVAYAGPLAGVGVYNVTANKDIGGTTDPEFTGTGTLTVGSAGLVVSNRNVSVLAGFDDVSSWNITYPTNATSILTGAQKYLRYNFTATLPNGTKITLNTTTAGETPNNDLGASATFQNGTGGGIAFASGTAPVIMFNSTASTGEAHLTFRPPGNWAAGTYTFSLVVNTRIASGLLDNTDCAACLQNAEYSTTWTLVPNTPAAVNLAVKNGATITFPTTLNVGDAVTALSVQPATSPGTSSAAAGGYTLLVNVTGSEKGQFPGSTPYPELNTGWTGGVTSNVTLRGDVLNTTIPTGGWAYNSGTGVVTLTNVIPTKVNGTVYIDVLWKNVTTTLSLAVTRGATSTTAPTEVIVDITSTLTVMVKDVYGNPQPAGKVFLFRDVGGAYPGVTIVPINGTGAPGLGGNGEYTFNIRPTEVGNITVYAEIGSNVGGTDNRNFSYTKVRVVPAHDVRTTLNATTGFASNRTALVLNATLSDGTVITGDASRFKVYFLNETEYTAFKATATLGQLYTYGTNTQPAFDNVVGREITIDSATANGAFLNVTLRPGTYRVYVCSNFTPAVGGACSTARHDNVGNETTFTVTPYAVSFAPDQIANSADFQRDTTVNITVRDPNGALANGTLRVSATNSTAFGFFNTTSTSGTNITTTTLTVTNGAASFFAAYGTVAGTLRFDFNPTGGVDQFSNTTGSFSVVGPVVTVDPTRVFIGAPTQVTVTVKALNGTALANKAVRLCGGPLGGAAPSTVTDGAVQGCTDNVNTDSAGQARVGVVPQSTGDLFVYVGNNKTSTKIPAVAGLVITYSPTGPVAGDTITVTVKSVSGIVQSNVNVTYTFNGTSTSALTDTNGNIVIPNAKEGAYALTATKSGFDQTNETITVGAKAVQPPPAAASFALENLDIPESATVGQQLQVSVDVSNSGNAAGTATVSLFVDNTFVESKQVPVDAGDTVKIAYSFTPSRAGTFAVAVRLQGGESETGSIVVTTPTTTPTTPTGATPTTPTGTTPTTPTGTTPTTPTGTTPTSPTGTTPTSPTGTTSPTPTTTPSPRVPGFEVVGLIAALGVALLVLRRRN